VFDIETKIGDIRIPNNIINRIITESVDSCGGKAVIYKYKGKYKNMFPDLASKMNLYDDEAGSIEVTETESGIEIKLYIVIRFGNSIKKTTETIIDNIYENMETIMGIRPEKVTVVVTGTLSRNIAKRNIEVSR